ncbi:MAG TPA: NAD-dependent deacylase [Chthoniobacterales bacterium]|jgi:NAD-dependent protein deacetylase/lipoamidase|nr:NAD-dependent deacylase [Chthoniobacterales bacterium]
MNFSPELVAKLRAAQKIVALTGAGISAESGLATFRDAQTGLWSKFRPEELATADAFRRDPKFVSDWYAWRREQALAAKPNAGHSALAEMEKCAPEFLLVTQNVDGLHARAGSERMVELHGNIHRFRCFENDCGSENFDPEERRCRSCGGNLRPDVVWFGEMLPVDALQKAIDASENCDAFFSIGTSSLVYPAADLWRRAKDAGALVIEINKDPTPLTPLADHSFLGKAGEILPALVSAVWNKNEVHERKFPE